MVERLSAKKIAIVDLDGTLIDGNSLYIFLLGGLRHGSILQRAKVAYWLFLRAVRVVSHAGMKFTLMRSIKPNPALRLDFKRKIEAARNPAVNALIARLKAEGCTVVLATAAADVYIPWIWDGPFVATPINDNPENLETRGERKLNAVMTMIGPDAEIAAVVTDHLDDLPLLMAGAKENYLVNPDKKTLDLVRREKLKFKCLPGNKSQTDTPIG